MHANKRELILRNEVYSIVGCAIEVLNVRGHGLHEKIHENCLCVEFRLRGIPYSQQQRHQVPYKGKLVGEYVPDLIVQEKLIVDTKTIDRITDHERGQMLNYLRITALPVGVILNFKHARLEWERLVLSSDNSATKIENATEAELLQPQGFL
jgi:GxxExxY protein